MLGAGVDVALGLLLGQEQAGGLDDVLSAASRSRAGLGGVTLGIHGDLLAVDDDGVLAGGHLAVELAVHGVILQHIGQVIRRDTGR